MTIDCKLTDRKIVVVSQTLLDYGVELSKNILLRLNLAWHEDLESAAKLLEKHKGYKIFLDVPVGRMKPPNYIHKIEDVAVLVARFSNIEYVAISNIEFNDLVVYCQRKIGNVKIVPKIETYTGVRNARDIIRALNYKDKVLMLDHQDLYVDLVSRGTEKQYLLLVGELEKTCRDERAFLLRTVGIVFSNWGTE